MKDIARAVDDDLSDRHAIKFDDVETGVGEACAIARPCAWN
jgi:hypothetical protein